jgi:Flp pilus assembly protein TadD
MAWTKTAEASVADDDVEAQAEWRCIRALILARRGELAEAEALARAGRELAFQTEAPAMRASTLSDLADVLSRAGRVEEARSAYGDAIAIYTAKGNVTSLRRAEHLLLAIQ